MMISWIIVCLLHSLDKGHKQPLEFLPEGTVLLPACRLFVCRHGSLMEETNIIQSAIDILNSLIGRLRGDPAAYISVLAQRPHGLISSSPRPAPPP